MRFLDREGKPQELAAEGLLATAIQHEIDHLNGQLIIDFLSRLKRDIIVRRFKKLAKETASGTGVRPLDLRAAASVQPCRRRVSSPDGPMRVVFMGTPDFAVPTLPASWRRGMRSWPSTTQPPRPAGRGMAESKSPVHSWPSATGLPVLAPGA